MYDERSYFLVQHFKKLKHWAQLNDFTIEYVDKMVDHEKETIENELSSLHQQIAMEVDQEIRFCIDQQIPFILMVRSSLTLFDLLLYSKMGACRKVECRIIISNVLLLI